MMRSMAQTRFATTRYDLAADALPLKANSPWPIYTVLILGAIALSVMWYIGRGPIHVTRPILTVENSVVTVSSKATNRTNKPVRVVLSFLLGYVSQSTNTASPTFRGIAHDEVDVNLEPHSTKIIRCQFPVADPSTNLDAEVQVLRSE